jgi:predicted glutamine amidotransferase
MNTDSKELIEVKTLDDLRELRNVLQQSKKKQANADAEFDTIPSEGVFAKIGVKEFTLVDNEGKTQVVKSLGLFTKNGEFISENNLTRQHLEEVLTSVKTGSRRGKFILKSTRLTNLNKFGKSLNQQLLKIVGKSFTTEKRDVRNYQQQYLTSATFDEVCQSANSDASLKDALSKTEIVNGYVFNIS